MDAVRSVKRGCAVIGIAKMKLNQGRERFLRQHTTCLGICETNDKAGSMTIGALMGSFCIDIKGVNDAFMVEVTVANFNRDRIHGISYALSMADLVGGTAHQGNTNIVLVAGIFSTILDANMGHGNAPIGV